jgi:hypothetical protein
MLVFQTEPSLCPHHFTCDVSFCICKSFGPGREGEGERESARTCECVYVSKAAKWWNMQYHVNFVFCGDCLKGCKIQGTLFLWAVGHNQKKRWKILENTKCGPIKPGFCLSWNCCLSKNSSLCTHCYCRLNWKCQIVCCHDTCTVWLQIVCTLLYVLRKNFLFLCTQSSSKAINSACWCDGEKIVKGIFQTILNFAFWTFSLWGILHKHFAMTLAMRLMILKRIKSMPIMLFSFYWVTAVGLSSNTTPFT